MPTCIKCNKEIDDYQFANFNATCPACLRAQDTVRCRRCGRTTGSFTSNNLCLDCANTDLLKRSTSKRGYIICCIIIFVFLFFRLFLAF